MLRPIHGRKFPRSGMVVRLCIERPMAWPYISLQRHSRHLLIVAWLTTWITAVPLFHVHIPDTTDRWAALQSGGPHTILTRDLPGEFSHPFHDHFGHLTQRGVTSPELSFALFNDKSDDKKAKQLYICSESYQDRNALLVSWPFECSRTFRGPPQPHAFPVFRAPPRVDCV
jgi:hypothetical protein